VTGEVWIGLEQNVPKILKNFGTRISDTISHQMTFQFPTSPNNYFCITLEKQNRQNMH